MRNFIALITATFIFGALIVPANAGQYDDAVKLDRIAATVYLNEKLGNWTDEDLGAWMITHIEQNVPLHGLEQVTNFTEFDFSAAKTKTMDVDGYKCAFVTGSLGKLKASPVDISAYTAEICISADFVIINIMERYMGQSI